MPDAILSLILKKLPSADKRNAVSTCRTFFERLVKAGNFKEMAAFRRAQRMALLPSSLAFLQFGELFPDLRASDLAPFHAVSLTFDRASCNKQLLMCLNSPSVRDVEVYHLTVGDVPSSVAVDVLYHTNFSTEDLDTLELTGASFPRGAIHRIKELAQMTHTVMLRPFGAHHVRHIIPLVESSCLEIFPMDMSADAASLAASILRRPATLSLLADKHNLEYTYKTEADMRVLMAVMKRHVDENRTCSIDVRSNYVHGPVACCPDFERALIAVVGREGGEGLRNPQGDVLITVGPEFARPEPLFAALHTCTDTTETYLDVSCLELTCGTPMASADVRLLFSGDRHTWIMHIRTTPRPGVTSDAWAWDAMTNVGTFCVGGLSVFGACEDLGIPNWHDVVRAGRNMGMAHMTFSCELAFRSDDASWMVPFLTGYRSTSSRRRHSVKLCAGQRAARSMEGMRSVTDPEVVALIEAIRVDSGSRVSVQCFVRD